MLRQLFVFVAVVFTLLAVTGCHRSNGNRANTVVFKHGKIEGDPQAFVRLLRKFNEKYPEIKIVDETLPSSTDEQHQFYIINLEGKSADFDVLALDVIWLPEFARAGWLRDLTHLIPPEERVKFFPAAMEAVTVGGKIYAIPWYIDAGLLYYRKDLLDMYGFKPPKTWYELVRIAQYVTKRHHDVYGFLWQGKQDESLVCNTLEYIWSNGGDVFHDGTPTLESAANAQALQFMRDLIVKYRVTPPLVTTANEEATRQIFGNGNALFMRNWPYAYETLRRDAAFRKKIGAVSLPAFPGNEPAATLGGWQLGINRNSRNPEAAEKLVKFLSSEESQRELAVAIGYKPTRMTLYQESCLLESQPFTCQLYGIFRSARPRPVTPYYMMVTQVMQSEFSASVSGIRTPEEALHSAQKQIGNIMKVGQ